MKYLSYILILLGASIALYAKAGEQQNQFILIFGIVILMIGVYRIARTIPSKKQDNQEGDNNLNNGI